MEREKKSQFPQMPVPATLQEYCQAIQAYGLGNSLTEPPRPFFYKYLESLEENWCAAMFVSPILKDLLETATRIHIDGTFKVVPQNLAYQLLSIHAMSAEHVSANQFRLSIYVMWYKTTD